MGKPQAGRLSDNDATKPTARWLSSAAATDPELAAEIAENAADLQRIRTRASAKSNKVCRFLSETFYRIDKTWPWLIWPLTGQTMRVRMYFPTKNLAVDQFPNPTDWDLKQVEEKKKLFKKHGIKYFPMLPQNKLMELADYL